MRHRLGTSVLSIVAAALATILLIAAVPRTALAQATFTVTTPADSGPGSLRQAITDANAAAGGTINFASGSLITLFSPLPIIKVPLTINGNTSIINGNNQHRVFFVDAPGGAAVTFSNFSVTNGRA